MYNVTCHARRSPSSRRASPSPPRAVGEPLRRSTAAPHDHRREHGRKRPDRQRSLPAEAPLERHSEPGRQRRADGQRRDVDARDNAGAAETPLHDARDDHVRHRDPGARQDRPREERRAGAGGPPEHTGDNRQQGQQDDPLRPETPRQRGRQRREQPEAEHRRGREEPRSRRGEVELVLQLVHDRRHACDRDSQVQPRQDDPGRQQRPARG